MEVDFILGNGEVAIEVKGKEGVDPRKLTGLKAYCEDYRPSKSIVVSLDSHPRQVGDVSILPWKVFLEKLWKGKITDCFS